MIYLAGSCSSEHRTFMRKIAGKLRELGETVYCPFELKIENAWDYSQEDWAKMVFDSDLTALDGSDTVIVISPGRNQLGTGILLCKRQARICIPDNGGVHQSDDILRLHSVQKYDGKRTG